MCLPSPDQQFWQEEALFFPAKLAHAIDGSASLDQWPRCLTALQEEPSLQ